MVVSERGREIGGRQRTIIMMNVCPIVKTGGVGGGFGGRCDLKIKSQAGKLWPASFRAAGNGFGRLLARWPANLPTKTSRFDSGNNEIETCRHLLEVPDFWKNHTRMCWCFAGEEQKRKKKSR